jgi:hypothetical protein
MRIAALYRIEETIRGKSAEQRRAVRHEQSAPHCDELSPIFGDGLIDQAAAVAD